MKSALPTHATDTFVDVTWIRAMSTDVLFARDDGAAEEGGTGLEKELFWGKKMVLYPAGFNSKVGTITLVSTDDT